jgi:serine/threonine-protein kinase
LLNAFVAVCNAVAYAHSRGVIHRDLKPQNVVLGDFREVILLDWGLAKLVDRPEEAADLSSVALGAVEPPAATMPGQVLGTPSYMLPEQAEGATVDFLSDVYGLGAILYEVLVGRPPFEGSDTRALLRRVVVGSPDRPRDAVPATPIALEAVCLKALAKRREERYASAKALAQDVEHWLADEPVAAFPDPWAVKARRWLGRHRTLTTAVAVTLMVLALSLGASTVLLTAANDREHRARQRAEANLRLARRAVDRRFTRVSESPELKSQALEGLRRDLLQEAKEFYEQFVQQHAGEPGLQAERGEAYLRLADITEHIGDRSQAIALAGQAQEIFAALVNDHGDVAAYQDSLSRALTTLGRNYREQGQFEHALQTLQRSVESRHKLVVSNPGVPSYRFQLAPTFNQLGLLYVRGLKKLPEGAAALKQAEALCALLVAEFPDEPEYRSELAQTYTNSMFQHSYSGKYDQAAADGERAVPILEQLVRDYPLVADYQFRLAFVLSNIAMSYGINRQPEKELAACSKALSVAEPLVRAHPEVPAYKNRLAFIRIERANALARRGDFRQAVSDLDTAENDVSEGMTYYNSACGYSLSALAVGKDASLALAERERLANRYLDRAMAVLLKAKNTTPVFKTEQAVDLLRTDADLKPLRQRDDFQRLLAQIEREARQRK